MSWKCSYQLEYWYDFHHHNQYLRVTIEVPSTEPQVFGIYDMDVGFILWLGSCNISFVVWIIEMILWLHVKHKWIKKWKKILEEKKADASAIKKAQKIKSAVQKIDVNKITTSILKKPEQVPSVELEPLVDFDAEIESVIIL